VAACVDRDGGRALLLGGPPELLTPDGTRRPVTDLPQGGTCAWSAGGAIIADLSSTTDGDRSRVRILDADATVTGRLDLPTEVAVSGDPDSPRVLYTAGGRLTELDPRTGVELRVVADVRAGRYDDAGSLVVVGADGAVRWLPPAGDTP
jgi:hypothetical protein